MPLSGNTCTERTQTATLTNTLSDLECIDVYTYVGSGEERASGWFVQSSDQTRVCRCDRTTNTCTTCMGGACDPPR